MKVTAELAKPQRLRPRVLPTQLRASLIEPLVRSTACANPRFDLQVVVPYFGELANYGAIPTITKSSLGKNACATLEFGVLCGTTSFGTLDICVDKEMTYACCGSTPRDGREYLLMGQAEQDAMHRTHIAKISATCLSIDRLDGSSRARASGLLCQHPQRRVCSVVKRETRSLCKRTVSR